MDLISLGIIGLVFILLIVFSVKSAKTWHWVNIVFVNLTFLAGVGASIGLAQAYHLRYEALLDLKNSREAFERSQNEADLARYGRPDSATYDRDSLQGKTQELALVQTGRGRVWSGGTISADEENRVFQFAKARQVAEANQIKLADVLLYVFADRVVGNADGGNRVLTYPQDYIGSVMVAAETPEKLTLKPVFIVDQQEWFNPTTTWSLFEKMSLDRHDTFKMGIVAFVDANKGTDRENEMFSQIAESILNDEMEIGPFRQVLATNYLTPERFGLDPASPEYEALLDRYSFDGFPLREIRGWIEENAANRVSQKFEPRPEDIFIKYKFSEDSQNSYKVDSDAGTLDTDGPFTELGLAVDRGLHSETAEGVQFREGDTVLVDQLTAQGQRGNEQLKPFVDQEPVEQVDQIYVRPLRDYPYLFSDLSRQTVNFMNETARVQATIAVQEQALVDAETQLQDRLATTAGLEDDNSNLKNDRDAISSLQSQREEDIRNLQAEIASLKDRIQENYNWIQEKTRNIERQVTADR